MATTAMGGNTALEAYIDPSIIELSNKSSKKRSRDSTEDGGLTDKKKRKREKEKQRTETREQVVRVGDELAEKSERKKKKKKKVLAQVETSSTAIPNPTAQASTPAPQLSLEELSLLDPDALLRTFQQMGRPSVPSTSTPKAPKATTSQSKKSVKSKPRILVSRLDDRSVTNAEDILSTRWLSTTQLNELAESQGLVFKKGKFSAIEDQQLTSAMEEYGSAKGLTQYEINCVIFEKLKGSQHTSFWSQITRAAPYRPIKAVYHHVRRICHPLKGQGPWHPAEDASLRAAVMELGQKWEEVSPKVGRSGPDCRDRWRNHISTSETRNTGTWSAQEEADLARIVGELTTDVGKDPDQDVFWSLVTEKMGNKRTRQQCRIKWLDDLNPRIKNNGETPRWSSIDAFILVHKVASLPVQDDTEIDWKLVSDHDWNLWSAHILRKRWKSIKESVTGWEGMYFRDIINELQKKYAEPPDVEAAASKPKKRTGKGNLVKVISSQMIEEDSSSEDNL